MEDWKIQIKKTWNGLILNEEMCQGHSYGLHQAHCMLDIGKFTRQLINSLTAWSVVDLL